MDLNIFLHFGHLTSSINPLNSDNKYNNTINRFSNINNNTHLKPFSNRLNTDNNKISSINSFHQFVNKMKNNQKFNKIQFNNLNNKINSGVNTVNDYSKLLNRVVSYFKTNMPEKKTLEMTGINNINNNLINNSVNHENNSVMNRLTNLNDDKNLTLPSLLSKNKKYIIPKGKGYFINKKGKINKITTYNTIQNNMIGNNNIFEKLNNFH